jgi:hypothetical protein
VEGDCLIRIRAPPKPEWPQNKKPRNWHLYVAGSGALAVLWAVSILSLQPTQSKGNKDLGKVHLSLDKQQLVAVIFKYGNERN